jgi:hypothetical protein
MAETTDPFDYAPASQNQSSNSSVDQIFGQMRQMTDNWSGKQSSTSTPNDVPMDPFETSIDLAKQDTRPKSEVFETTYFNPDTLERYKDVKSLYNDHFDPTADNERVAYENWDKWDAIGAGLGRFKDSFVNAYAASAGTWSQAGKALFHMDMSAFDLSQASMDKEGYLQQRTEIENPIFYAPGTEDDILTKGFLAESIGNLGFTLGTLAEVGTEFVIGKGLEALTFGAAAPVVEAEMAAKLPLLARVGSMFKQMATTFKMAAVGEKLPALAKSGLMIDRAAVEAGVNLAKSGQFGGHYVSGLRSMAAKSNVGLKAGTDLWDNALKIASNIPFVGQMADAGRMIRAGRQAQLTTNQLIKIGAGGLKRSFAEWQMAYSEASIEAGGNYNDLVGQLTNEYKKTHGGNDPVGDEFVRIRELAMRSATSALGANAAILAITNKLQFGNILGKFSYDDAAVLALRRAMGEDAAKLGILAVQEGTKTGFYRKGSLGMLGILPKITSDFGGKRAAWEFGKDMVRGLTRIELSEGLQENMQEVASLTTKNYYADIYKTGVASWGKNFSDAIDAQMTRQGYKTFLGGALTGVFLGPAYHVAGQVANKFSKSKIEHEKAIDASVEYLNNWVKQDSNTILNENVKQIKLQHTYNDGMVEGVQTKDKRQYYNNQDSALIQLALHAKRTGTTDYVTAFIDGYSNNYTGEQFKEAFGYDPKDIGYGSHQEVFSEVARRVDNFNKIYDKHFNKWQMYMDMEGLIDDPYAKQKFSIKKAALLDAITTAAFIESKGERAIVRQKDLRSSIAKHKSIGDSLASSFDTISNYDNLRDTRKILFNEIKNAQEIKNIEGTTEDAKEKLDKTIAEKTKELEYLNQAEALMYEEREVDSPDPDSKEKIRVMDIKNLFSTNGAQRELAGVLANYFQLKNDQSKLNVKVNLDDVSNAIKDIYDYVALGQEHIDYVDALNMLEDPDKAGKYLTNLMDARAGAHARLLHEAYTETLPGLSEIGKKFAEDNKDLLDELLAFAAAPMGNYDNYKRLDEISEELKTRRFEGAKEFVEQQTIDAEKQQKDKELEEKRKADGKTIKPVIVLFQQYNEEQDPEKKDEILKEIQDYMLLRYDLVDIQNNFPFDETDVNKRVVPRYTRDENGNRIKIQDVPVPVTYAYHNGPVNDYNSVHTFLSYFEQSEYNKYAKEQVTSPQDSDPVVTAVDDEKLKLKNFVGQKVILNGKKGTLEIESDKYIVRFEDGTRPAELAFAANDTVSFDDFVGLTPDYTNQTGENKEVLNHQPHTVVDVQESGTATIAFALENNLQTAIINGVEWQMEKDENGLVTGFTRTFEKKKGKSSKKFIERLSGNNPKAKDYVKRINMFLMKMKPIPENIEEQMDEVEVLATAIEDVKQDIAKDSDIAMKKADERFTEYQLNKIKNQEIPQDILEIKIKFDTPTVEGRGSLTNDELLKLFVWADDLRDKISKYFRLYTTNPIVYASMLELEKQYINPISEIIDHGTIRDTTVKKKTATKKRGTVQPAEDAKSREGQLGPQKDQSRVGKKEAGSPTSRGLKKEIESAENKARKSAQLGLFGPQLELFGPSFETLEPLTGKAAPIQTFDLTEEDAAITNITNDITSDLENAITIGSPTEEQIIAAAEEIGEEITRLYQKIQMEEMMAEAQMDETIDELRVLRYMPKILPESAREETGGNSGTKSDIHISFLSNKGVTVDTAAQDVMEHFQSEGDYTLNEEQIRDIILDILTSGSKAAYEAKFKGTAKELKQLKEELKELEEKQEEILNPKQKKNPFEKLNNKTYC